MVPRAENLHNLQERNELFKGRVPRDSQNIMHHHSACTQVR